MIANIEDSVGANDWLIYHKPKYDNMISAEVALQLDENVVSGWLKFQALLLEGRIAGRHNVNPIMNYTIH